MTRRDLLPVEVWALFLSHLCDEIFCVAPEEKAAKFLLVLEFHVVALVLLEFLDDLFIAVPNAEGKNLRTADALADLALPGLDHHAFVRKLDELTATVSLREIYII